MHSSMIGKVEKAMRYAHEPDRVKISGLTASFSGDNGAHTVSLDAAKINLEWVLGNKLLVGCVNAHRDDFLDAAADLVRIERRWPSRPAVLPCSCCSVARI